MEKLCLGVVTAFVGKCKQCPNKATTTTQLSDQSLLSYLQECGRRVNCRSRNESTSPKTHPRVGMAHQSCKPITQFMGSLTGCRVFPGSSAGGSSDHPSRLEETNQPSRGQPRCLRRLRPTGLTGENMLHNIELPAAYAVSSRFPAFLSC